MYEMLSFSLSFIVAQCTMHMQMQHVRNFLFHVDRNRAK